MHISFDRVLPDQAQGSLDDPKIQQLLLYAAQSNRNSGVRLDSISVLSQNPQDNQVREALIYAVRYDKNPGVRLKALDGLKGFVATDTRVRDALLDALVNDSESGRTDRSDQSAATGQRGYDGAADAAALAAQRQGHLHPHRFPAPAGEPAGA